MLFRSLPLLLVKVEPRFSSWPARKRAGKRTDTLRRAQGRVNAWMSPVCRVVFAPRKSAEPAGQIETAMRGGLSIDRLRSRTSEGGSGHRAVAIRCSGITPRAIEGTARKAQHQHMLLQPSGTIGAGWLAWGCDEGSCMTSGPSHRSQCGE